MTQQEKLMYQILGEISNTDAPIVFKGALITKLVLAENNYNAVQRLTRDIDANWVGNPPSMSVLVDTVNQSLGKLENKWYAVATREYGEKKSAGISIRAKATDDEVADMDIDIRSLTGSRDYYFGEARIKGVLANEILADKISVLASQKIFRRTKDLVDVYALSHCVTVSTAEIFEICDKKGQTIESFIPFYDRKADLKHAYDRLRGVEGKPPFDEIYTYMSGFLKVFSERDKTKTWDNNTFKWSLEKMPELPPNRLGRVNGGECR